jgi:hypothetical protein
MTQGNIPTKRGSVIRDLGVLTGVVVFVGVAIGIGARLYTPALMETGLPQGIVDLCFYGLGIAVSVVVCVVCFRLALNRTASFIGRSLAIIVLSGGLCMGAVLALGTWSGAEEYSRNGTFWTSGQVSGSDVERLYAGIGLTEVLESLRGKVSVWEDDVQRFGAKQGGYYYLVWRRDVMWDPSSRRLQEVRYGPSLHQSVRVLPK